MKKIIVEAIIVVVVIFWAVCMSCGWVTIDRHVTNTITDVKNQETTKYEYINGDLIGTYHMEWNEDLAAYIVVVD